MKKISVLLILMLVFAFFASPVGAMIGGELDTEHTNVGAIMMLWTQIDGKDDFIGRLCTATLIHPRVLITAAHCYPYFVNQGISYNEIWVTFDQDPFAEPDNYLGVANFIPHPDFDPLSADTHDIALLVLTDSVPDDIVPEQLPDDVGYMDKVVSQKKGQQDIELNVVGYGTDQYRIPPDFQLDAFRRAGTVYYKAQSPTEIRTEPNNAILCWGDSGGPLYHVDNKGNEVQMIGVYSRGGSKKCVEGGFHYRLDTEGALEWINTELNQLD